MTKRNRNKKRKKATEKGSYRQYTVIAVLAACMVGYYLLVQFSEGAFRKYPTFVEGVFLDSSIVSPSGIIEVPKDFVKENKLVYVDVKLENAVEEFRYLGRTIPLGWYQNGDYLPILVISTPSGKTLTGIRVCEPCGSFSFHILEKKYLDCDACHTRWNIETLKAQSGACGDYPPPLLPSSVDDEIKIDLSQTKLMFLI
jgi:hypothetical protein